MLQTFLVLLLWLSSSLQSALESSTELILEDQSNVQITGGDEAKPHAYPYMVKLTILERIGQRYIFRDCDGSLISKQYILTAAHCLATAPGGIIDNIYIILGAHNWKSSTENGHQELYSNVYVIHEGFVSSDSTAYNDIGLIQLPTKANITKEVDLVKLPKRGDTSKSYVGESANLTGWGRMKDSADSVPEKLRVVSVEVTDSEVCESEFEAVLEKQICTAGSYPINKSACSGDSGGPLVINGTQIGIISYASSLCEWPGAPTVHTKVDEYLDWIALHSDVDIN